jgi:hypothetical protein
MKARYHLEDLGVDGRLMKLDLKYDKCIMHRGDKNYKHNFNSETF